MAAIPNAPEEIILKGYDPHLTRRLLKFIGPYRPSLFLAVFLILVSSAAAVAGPYLVKVALDAGLSAGSMTTLRNSVLLYLLLSLAQ